MKMNIEGDIIPYALDFLIIILLKWAFMLLWNILKYFSNYSLSVINMLLVKNLSFAVNGAFELQKFKVQYVWILKS